ncbi:MAG TPA: hypothetical protein VHC18_03155 [Amycolatopsis sp.]|nr:hypothetical protein [Amycolatopsis sp.]
MDSRRRTGNRAGQQAQPDNNTQNVLAGPQQYGRSVSRVDFFRRMPVGGTAYLNPVGSEGSED